MRLIDADELKKDLKDNYIYYGESELLNDFYKALDEQPTVQAVPIDVLDKIRAELHATAEMHEDGDYYLREKWIDEIIDKYKAESEEDGITFNNLCSSCTNIGCEFQSGIVRTKCAFYMPPHIESDNCGNYVVMQSTAEVFDNRKTT